MKKKIAAILLSTFFFSGCAGSIPKNALELSPQSLADRQLQTRKFDTTNYEAMLSAAAAVFQDLGFTLEESEYTLGVIVGSKQRDATHAGQVAGAILIAALGGGATAIDSHQVIRASMVMREAAPPSEGGVKESPQLTLEGLQNIKKEVAKSVSEGLMKKFPAEISVKVASKIAEDTAKTLTTDLAKLIKAQEGGGESLVRVTFQRVIFNTAGQVTRREQINDPALYREFFDKLAQSVFLEAHEI